MIVKVCDKCDIDQVYQILDSQTMMYGIELETFKLEIKKRIHDSVNGILKTDCVIGVFDQTNLVGFAIQIFPDQAPVWRLGMLFFLPAIAAKPRLQLKIGSLLFEFCTNRAEENNRNSFFYVVRDQGQARFGKSMELTPSVATRYEIADLCVIKPFEYPTMKFFRELLGFTLGKNTKTLVIRQGFLKTEYRKNIW